MSVLDRKNIEISQQLKQIEVNKEIEKLRIEEKEIEEEIKKLEEPKKMINKILTYFNSIFNKMFSRYIKDERDNI